MLTCTKCVSFSLNTVSYEIDSVYKATHAYPQRILCLSSPISGCRASWTFFCPTWEVSSLCLPHASSRFALLLVGGHRVCPWGHLICTRAKQPSGQAAPPLWGDRKGRETMHLRQAGHTGWQRWGRSILTVVMPLSVMLVCWRMQTRRIPVLQCYTLESIHYDP